MIETSDSQKRLPDKYQAGSVVIPRRRPDEMAFPLTQEEFQTLGDGTSGKEKASTDLFLGFLVGAIVGLIGVIASTDWERVLDHKWPVGISMLILIGMVVWSSTGCFIHWRLATREDTPESRLKKKISDFFQAPPISASPSAALPSTKITIQQPLEGAPVPMRDFVRGKVQPAGHPVQVFVSTGGMYYSQGIAKPDGDDWQMMSQFGTEYTAAGTACRVVAIDGAKYASETLTAIPNDVASSQTVNVIRK
jgi:hypothetical protein